MDTESQLYTESQLNQLDDLLQSFNNINHCANTKVNGDDDDMVKNVTDISKISNEKNPSVYCIKSSYTK